MKTNLPRRWSRTKREDPHNLQAVHIGNKDLPWPLWRFREKWVVARFHFRYDRLTTKRRNLETSLFYRKQRGV